MEKVDWRFATAWMKTVPCAVSIEVIQTGTGPAYNHAGVGDKRVAPATHFSNGLQQPGSEIISKPKGVDGSRELAHGPQLGDVSLCRTHVVWHAVGQDHEGRHVSCAAVVDILEKPNARINTTPQIGRVFRLHFFNLLGRGALGCPGHGGEGLDNLVHVSKQVNPLNLRQIQQDLPFLA